jgi:hypothetical protein
MLKPLIIGVLSTVAFIWSANAQSVQQSGGVTPGHAAMWTTTGIIQDAGPATQGKLTGIGTAQSGPSICANSGPVTGPYNQLCLGTSQTGGGVLSFNNFGGGTGGFSITSNGSPLGVSCSGTPTSSFTSVNGIVTHC